MEQVRSRRRLVHLLVVIPERFLHLVQQYGAAAGLLPRRWSSVLHLPRWQDEDRTQHREPARQRVFSDGRRRQQHQPGRADQWKGDAVNGVLKRRHGFTRHASRLHPSRHHPATASPGFVLFPSGFQIHFPVPAVLRFFDSSLLGAFIVYTSSRGKPASSRQSCVPPLQTITGPLVWASK